MGGGRGEWGKNGEEFGGREVIININIWGEKRVGRNEWERMRRERERETERGKEDGEKKKGKKEEI